MQFNGTHKVCQRCFKILHKAGIKTSGNTKTNNWQSKDVRKTFLDFFCKKYDHKFVPSSSVIPKKGEGTYFTNAGMNQFKPIFLGSIPSGSELESYRRVANSQKCIRVGGKHNDLDDVGQDLTHHTFFEMMGSWSFGDYFKKEACAMALELLTGVYKLPLDRLFFTYFGGNEQLGLSEDAECKNIWRELGIPENHILPFGIKDNFWDMGEVGPCGPCTEIHYDHIGGRDASQLVNRDSPEVVEIWNLVFMQFERQTDQSLRPLPQQHVDTGMGLERMCAVLQGTISNYDTDLFTPLFNWLQKTTGAPAYSGKVGLPDISNMDTAYRIIADHSRMFTVCIADGLLPARVGIEQKLRSIMHRSIQQYCNILKGPPDNIAGLIPLVADSLGEAYPEIFRNLDKILEVVNQTEYKYHCTIDAGKKQLAKLLKQHGDVRVLSGEHIRALHEGRYGNAMALETVEDIAEVYGIAVDLDDFHQLLGQEKMLPDLEQHGINPTQLSQAFIGSLNDSGVLPTNDEHKYNYEKTSNGYNFNNNLATSVSSIICGDKIVKEAKVNDNVSVILAETQFYSEAGGQVGDKGLIKTQTGTVDVYDTQSSHGYVLHHGLVTEGSINSLQDAVLQLDGDHRLGCMRNHTATHLINAALRQIIGDVKQRGSCVGPDKFTFDFSCVKSVGNEDLEKLEDLVSNTIQKSLPVVRKTLPLNEALKIDGVVSLENEAYPSEVHVLSITDDSDSENTCQSTELCGGTHIHNTADIGSFCVSNLSGVAQGIKGIVCLTGTHADQAIENGVKLKSLYTTLEEAINNIKDHQRWEEWKIEINRVMNEDMLPKLVRDEVRQKMIALTAKLAAKKHNVEAELLKRDIIDSMEDISSSYVIKQARMKKFNSANSMLQRIEVTKPVILIVNSSKGSGIFIVVPKGFEELRTALIQAVESVATHPTVKPGKDVVFIHSKWVKSEIFIDACERILNRTDQTKSAEVLD